MQGVSYAKLQGRKALLEKKVARFTEECLTPSEQRELKLIREELGRRARKVINLGFSLPGVNA